LHSRFCAEHLREEEEEEEEEYRKLAQDLEREDVSCCCNDIGSSLRWDPRSMGRDQEVRE